MVTHWGKLIIALSLAGCAQQPKPAPNVNPVVSSPKVDVTRRQWKTVVTRQRKPRPSTTKPKVNKDNPYAPTN